MSLVLQVRILLLALLLNVVTVGSVQVVVHLTQQAWLQRSLLESVEESFADLVRVYSPVRDAATDAAVVRRLLANRSMRERCDDIIITSGRPPYGVYTDAVLATAAQAGYTKTIMWSLDTIDWRPLAEGGPTAEQIASTVVTSSGSGSIILMHLGGYETLDALRMVVPALRERGLLLTSVSDLVD